MKSNNFCSHYCSGTCAYKKNSFPFKANVKISYACSRQDKEDYQTYSSTYWFPKKIKLFYSSICPVVSLNWWKNL